MFYYASDGTTFKSKIAALEYRRDTNKEIGFYYFDHVYSKINWKIEPPESLHFYYKEQAQRLRDEYDYLILCYSGGYDSTNILETFHFNNIKLDKIVIVGAFGKDSSSGSDENHNGELYHNAFPYINELGLAGITEKHDYSELFADPTVFSVMQHDHDWIDLTGGWFSPHNWFWRDIEKHVIPKNIGSKKVGLIFGRDKPMLANGKFNFIDTPVTSYGNSLGTKNCDRINFYWDPKAPNILLKQLHLLNKVSAINGMSRGYNSELGAQTFGKIDINRIIYDLKRPLVFKSPKSVSRLISRRDAFLFKGSRDEQIFKRHAAGLKKLQDRVGLDKLATAGINSRSYEII